MKGRILLLPYLLLLLALPLAGMARGSSPDDEEAVTLRDPQNLRTTIEYDPVLRMYVVRTRIGDHEIVTPSLLSPKEYDRQATRTDMARYFRMRDSEPDSLRSREPFDILGRDFRLSPLDRVFGPGGVKIGTTGSVQLSMGITSNRTDNPSLQLNQRRKTYFNFDQKIQAGINASVGEKLRFDMNYNTDATFDFDSKNLKLNYEGQEDDIIKSIEAGNVSMTTGSSLIRGSTSLFGIKSKLQFGKLTLTGLISQQNSESKSVGSQGGVQTQKFNISAADYDANRHFFLAQYFYDNYDDFASKLPYVSSGVQITRIEVWVTNKRGTYSESRNLVAFQDLGESGRLASSYWQTDRGSELPRNSANNLLSVIKTQYPDARQINSVTQALAPLQAYGITGGRDYEKVESARKLEPSEYTLNSTLGYISLKSALSSDEVLAVAYEYTAGGQVYQVGEFSSDVTTTDQSLYLKMLRATTQSPKLPMWKLMMKNVYSTGGYQIQRSNFRMDIKFLSDTTGTELTYLPIATVSGTPLLQLMNLDRLDSNQESNPDGFFDFIEGYTVNADAGRVIFPVAEPFGRNLEKKIGNPQLAAEFTFPELYDSTLVVARQFAHKNKYSLTGEFKASGGATINLGAMNIPRGSVIVTAGGSTLVENVDYTVDYTMGTVTIINQSIADSGTPVNVTLENQALFSMQRKTLLGLDAQYKVNSSLTVGGTLMHFSEKALTEKVAIGSELVNNTIWGLNVNYNKNFMWLTDLLNRIPTVNAQAPSSFSFTGEFAQLMPHAQKSSSAKGSSYIDDFETAQSGFDLRSPYSWSLASTPFDPAPDALFPEAALSNNPAYGKNRALLSWYYIDRMWTRKNSSLLPGYMKRDYEQLSNPYVREVNIREIYPDRDVAYGEANLIQTLNLSFYPEERGPYNVDADNITGEGALLNPQKRWGGIMRRLDNTDFESSNVEYLQFWLLDPFLDPDKPNHEGGDLYFNFGDISEDILKDGMKTYENGNPIDGDSQYMKETVWGRVSTQNSLTYAFENAPEARPRQDVGLDGLKNDEEFGFSTYADYLSNLRNRLSASTVAEMEGNPFSPFSDPAGDNYHYYLSDYYDSTQASILERYKRYNGVEGNSLSPDQSDNRRYQAAKTTPDVEDINVDNTLNEYERYYQYHVSLRPEDLVVGRNYVTDKQVSVVSTQNGPQETVWYQFKIPLSSPDKTVGDISDFSSIRFARIFMTGFSQPTHLRFATLELVRGEWRDYAFSLNTRGDAPAEGELDVSVVNIEENSGRTPVNYVLPPDVTRIIDPSLAQATRLNEQSLSLKVTGLHAGDARAVYKNSMLDLRQYKRIQMWTHAERLVDDPTDLQSGQVSLFVRLGSDVKNNYYEYEIPLDLTAPGNYNNSNSADRAIVWPMANRLDVPLSAFTDVKTERNRQKSLQSDGVGYGIFFSHPDPDNDRNTVGVMGNPSLSDVRVIMVGVRNRAATTKDVEVWVNELKVTDFNQDGGWAANVNSRLAMSDIATVTFAGHVETDGFGSVDQGLSSRRIDTYKNYTVALQADPGKLLPKKLGLSAPIYYSRSQESTTPRYNPLDQDILLDDALDAAATRRERDSIMSFARTTKTTEAFSLSNLRFERRSKRPMPWDPANFQLSFSFNKQRNQDPTTIYEHSDDYRGAFQYSYTPGFSPWKPFAGIKSKKKSALWLRDWQFNWIFTSLAFRSNMSRYYYELQTRSAGDANIQLPLQVSKNFIWDRQLNLIWNLTQSLSFTFASNTTARIEETIGAVNKKLFPDQYKAWRDTVWSSIKHLGTPWGYNQTFTGTWRAPFAKLPALSWLTGNLAYNSVYSWNRGATVDGLSVGNTIQNQTSATADARITFATLYNLIPRLKEVSNRFSGRQSRTQQKRQPAKRFERAITLTADSAVRIAHNLKTKKVRIGTTPVADSDSAPLQRVKVTTKVIDANTVELTAPHDMSVKLVVTEIPQRNRGFLDEVVDYSLRIAMSPSNLSFRWRGARSLYLPLFAPEVGDIFGQTRSGGPMAPGVGFAFGFFNESYVEKALDRGWLLTETGQTSPAIWNKSQEFNFEFTLEPIPGLKIQLTSNLTDNRTSQTQFMYAGMPAIYSGSYLRTHVALASALRNARAEDGYSTQAFTRFLEYIPLLRERVEAQYAGVRYPTTGFMSGSAIAGQPYDPEVGTVSQTSPDVLIPAFLAAYSGSKPEKITLEPFPGLSSMLPNWRVTYDGLLRIPALKNRFKALTLSHSYQCTYNVGSYSSYSNWAPVGTGGLGFTLDASTDRPIPSRAYNISSVAITERFAPLIGLTATLNNDLTLNAEYRDSRTLSLNTSAGQLVEAYSRQFTVAVGYKIIGFNKILKLGKSQKTFSNDLSLRLDLSTSSNSSLIRRIETAYTQATAGSRTFALSLMATYTLSRNLSLSAFFDHQANTPLVSQSAYPTTNTNYGLSVNLGLAR